MKPTSITVRLATSDRLLLIGLFWLLIAHLLQRLAERPPAPVEVQDVFLERMVARYPDYIAGAEARNKAWDAKKQSLLTDFQLDLADIGAIRHEQS